MSSNSQNMPLVSIYIPSYNNEKYIAETINCIINQTYKNWELVISDDCSMDKTVQIVKSFNDSRIRLIEQKTNLGLGGNWNSSISELKGEYVKLLCGDDLITKDCLEKQVAIFLSDKFPSVSLVSCQTQLINAEGKVLFTKKFPFKSGEISSKAAINYNYIFGKNVIGEPGSGLFKRNAFEKIGNYDASNSYLIDLDFWFRVLLLGNLYVIPEPMASFRLNKGAETTKLKNNQAKLFMQFAKKFLQDKRFNISKLHYALAYINSHLMQFLRGLVLKFFAK